MAATAVLPLAMPPVNPSRNIFVNHRADAVDGEAELAGEARRRRAALTVLPISMVIVMGPTPPGTGVSAPAVLTASG